MMKLINRLLVIAVIAFGSWFLIQQWDKVETQTKETIITEEVTVPEKENQEEIVSDIDSIMELGDTFVVDEDPEDKPVRKIIQEPLSEPVQKPIIKYTKPVATQTPVVETEVISVPVYDEGVKTDVTIYLFAGGFDISRSTVPEGTITFNVRNDGRMSHEFAIKGIQDFGRIIPGEKKSFTVNLKAGEYEIFSPREVDLSLDMRETLVVEAR